MATLNPVIVPAKALKGGKHKLRISIAHNGETRYILTDIILDNDKQFKNGLVVKRPDANYLNTKLRGIIQSLQSSIDELGFINGMTCAELVFNLKNAPNKNHKTLGAIFDDFISTRKVASSTVICYNRYFNVISHYIKKELFVENLTYSSILSLEKNLIKRGLCQSSIKIYMSFLSTLLNFAKKCGYVTFKVDPFALYKMPRTAIRDSWLTTDQLKAIRDFKSKKTNIIKTRDLFMLSYYLGGINIADIMQINFKDNKDRIRYQRQKVKGRMPSDYYIEFSIPTEAKKIIVTLIDKDGYINTTDYQKKDMHSFIQYNIHVIGKALGIDNLIFYSARKSFSQHAFNLGVRDSVIDYILGHKVGTSGHCSSALIHYRSVTPEMATNAIRLVLDNLK